MVKIPYYNLRKLFGLTNFRTHLAEQAIIDFNKCKGAMSSTSLQPSTWQIVKKRRITTEGSHARNLAASLRSLLIVGLFALRITSVGRGSTRSMADTPEHLQSRSLPAILRLRLCYWIIPHQDTVASGGWRLNLRCRTGGWDLNPDFNERVFASDEQPPASCHPSRCGKYRYVLLVIILKDAPKLFLRKRQETCPLSKELPISVMRCIRC